MLPSPLAQHVWLLFGAHEVLVEMAALDGARDAADRDVTAEGPLLDAAAAAVAWLARRGLLTRTCAAPTSSSRATARARWHGSSTLTTASRLPSPSSVHETSARRSSRPVLTPRAAGRVTSCAARYPTLTPRSRSPSPRRSEPPKSRPPVARSAHAARLRACARRRAAARDGRGAGKGLALLAALRRPRASRTLPLLALSLSLSLVARRSPSRQPSAAARRRPSRRSRSSADEPRALVSEITRPDENEN